MTLSEYSARWLAQLPHRVSDRTVEAYGGSLRRNILPALGDVDLRSLARRQVRDWCKANLAAGMSPSYVGATLTALQAMLTAAVDDEEIDANVAHTASRNLWRVKPAPRRLTPVQVDALLAAARRLSPFYAAAFGLAVRTGLRSAELLGLQARDVQGAKLHVRRQWKGGGRVIPHTKGGGSRFVDLSDHAQVILMERIALAREEPHWLFCCGEKRQPAHQSTLQKVIRSLALEVGLPATLRVHDLRHSQASRIRELGAPMEYIQAQLGHADTRTTGHYVRGAEPPATPEFVARLDAGLTDVAVRRPIHGARPVLRLVRRPARSA